MRSPRSFSMEDGDAGALLDHWGYRPAGLSARQADVFRRLLGRERPRPGFYMWQLRNDLTSLKVWLIWASALVGAAAAIRSESIMLAVLAVCSVAVYAYMLKNAVRMWRRGVLLPAQTVAPLADHPGGSAIAAGRVRLVYRGEPRELDVALRPGDAARALASKGPLEVLVLFEPDRPELTYQMALAFRPARRTAVRTRPSSRTHPR